MDLIVEPDNGMSDAINRGFKAARGEWVIWLNTDDRLKLGALAVVKEFAASQPNADVIYGAWDFIDRGGNYQRTMQVFPFKKLMLAHYGCYIGSTATFLRRSSIIDEGLVLNERFKYVMDGEYYNRLAARDKKFVHIPIVIADFRMHRENISQKNLMRKDIDGVLDKMLQYAEGQSIRRCYGVTIFKNDYLNNVVDCFLYYAFRLFKLPLKLMNKPKSLA